MGIRSVSYAICDTFDEAAKAAGAGYENPILFADCKTTEIAPPLDLPDYCAPIMAAVGISSSGKDKLRVLDVGGWNGDIGNFCRFAYPAINFDWTIVETRAAVEQMAPLNPAASFTAEIPSAYFDLVIFSGSIQYLPYWREALMSVQASSFILMARTPLAVIELPFLQTVVYDGGTVRYPGRIIPEREIYNVMESQAKLLHWQFSTSINGIEYPAPAILWRNIKS